MDKPRKHHAEGKKSDAEGLILSEVLRVHEVLRVVKFIETERGKWSPGLDRGERGVVV